MKTETDVIKSLDILIAKKGSKNINQDDLIEEDEIDDGNNKKAPAADKDLVLQEYDFD